MRLLRNLVTFCLFGLLLVACASAATDPIPATQRPTIEGPVTGTRLPASVTPSTEPTALPSATMQAPATETPLATATATFPPTEVPIEEGPATETPPASGAVESPVTEIPLTGSVAQPKAEVSGMAWYGDYLILLPQYPDFAIQQADGAVFALSKADLLAYLDGTRTEPLEPIPVPFIAPGLADQILGFEGYEAITFLADRAYLTIEARETRGPRGMRGYLVSGRIAPDLGSLVLNTATVVEIPSQPKVGNKSDEALLVAGDRLVTIYEVNGAAINPSPVAHLFDTQLAPSGTLPFPNVEYRITDATVLDQEGRFWAINYFFPGDTNLATDSDPLAERYGQGPTHAQAETVERLLEFEYSESGIDLVDRPPIQLELMDSFLGGLGRNWEGLARLDDRGFLLVTDLFPGTILGFVPAPEQE
jgi:hypothetical protein